MAKEETKTTKTVAKTKFKKGDKVIYTDSSFTVVESILTQFGEAVKLYGRVGYVDAQLIRKA